MILSSDSKHKFPVEGDLVEFDATFDAGCGYFLVWLCIISQGNVRNSRKRKRELGYEVIVEKVPFGS